MLFPPAARRHPAVWTCLVVLSDAPEVARVAAYRAAPLSPTICSTALLPAAVSL